MEPIVTFDLRHGRITIEGAGEHLGKILEEAVAIIAEHEPEPLPKQPAAATPPSIEHQEVSNNQPGMREFARKLPCRNFYERIAALLYHAMRIEGKPSLSTQDMEDRFGFCGFKKPAHMYSVLKYARWRAGYVDRVGRDQWALTPAGENRVLELMESSEGAAAGANA